MKSGDAFKGIFFAVTLEGHDSAYLLKMVQQVKQGNKNDSNGVAEYSWDYIGAGEDYSMTFDLKDVIDLAVEGSLLSTQNKLNNGMDCALPFRFDWYGLILLLQAQAQAFVPMLTSPAIWLSESVTSSHGNHPPQRMLKCHSSPQEEHGTNSRPMSSFLE